MPGCRTPQSSSSTTSSRPRASSSWSSSTSRVCLSIASAPHCASTASSVDDRASSSSRRACSPPSPAAHGARNPESGELAPVVHRDVNPSNILIPWDGHVKLADFGIAKLAGVSGDTQEPGTSRAPTDTWRPSRCAARPSPCVRTCTRRRSCSGSSSRGEKPSSGCSCLTSRCCARWPSRRCLRCTCCGPTCRSGCETPSHAGSSRRPSCAQSAPKRCSSCCASR